MCLFLVGASRVFVFVYLFIYFCCRARGCVSVFIATQCKITFGAAPGTRRALAHFLRSGGVRHTQSPSRSPIWQHEILMLSRAISASAAFLFFFFFCCSSCSIDSFPLVCRCLFLPSLAPHNAPGNNSNSSGVGDGDVISGMGTGTAPGAPLMTSRGRRPQYATF